MYKQGMKSFNILAMAIGLPNHSFTWDKGGVHSTPLLAGRGGALIGQVKVAWLQRCRVVGGHDLVQTSLASLVLLVLSCGDVPLLRRELDTVVLLAELARANQDKMRLPVRAQGKAPYDGVLLRYFALQKERTITGLAWHGVQ